MLTIIELINHDSWIRSEKKAGRKLECDGQKFLIKSREFRLINVYNDRNSLLIFRT